MKQKYHLRLIPYQNRQVEQPEFFLVSAQVVLRLHQRDLLMKERVQVLFHQMLPLQILVKTTSHKYRLN